MQAEIREEETEQEEREKGKSSSQSELQLDLDRPGTHESGPVKSSGEALLAAAYVWEIREA